MTTRYAYLNSQNIITEIFDIPDGVSVNDAFSSEYVERMRNLSGIDPAPEVGWKFDGQRYTPVSQTPSLVGQTKLLEYLADKRWRVETAGIAYQGHRLGTDRESQTKIIGAAVAAQVIQNYNTCWKMEDGEFLCLDAAHIAEMATLAAQHVTACYAKENEAKTKILSGEITTIAQINALFQPLE